MNIHTVNPTRAILWSGLSAGVLDLLGAFVTSYWRGVTLLRVLHSVASGWLGAAAFTGGYKAAALGFVSHFIFTAISKLSARDRC